MRLTFRMTAAVTIALTLCISARMTQAQIPLLANWQPDTVADGTGKGVMLFEDFSVGLNYFTSAVGNAGTTDTFDRWWLSKATNDAVQTPWGSPYISAGVLGATAGSPVLQTITFSRYMQVVYLFVNYANPTAILDFGNMPLTLLDSNNAQLNGSVVTFTGASGSFDDGVAVRIGGTFDELHPLNFTYSTTAPEDTMEFTIASVPESGSLVLLVAGALPILVIGLRRRRC